jgi:hypothetical protein
LAEIHFNKADMLLAIDSAIGQLVTIRTVLVQSLPESFDGDVVHEAPAPGPHDCHKVIPGGFGDDPFCLDCGVSVGVSGYPDEVVEP